MKKLLLIGLVLASVFLVAYTPPPEVPSFFYGEVVNGFPGQRVTTNYEGSTRTIYYEGKVYYQLDVYGGSPHTVVVFYINGQAVGVGVCIPGLNQRVDLTYKPFRYFFPLFWWWR